MNLRKAPWYATDFVMTLTKGEGEISVRFARSPHTLRVTPLSNRDQVEAPGSNISQSQSAVTMCLTNGKPGATIVIKAVKGPGVITCLNSDGRKILHVPVTGGGSTAHLSLHVAVADVPSIFALTHGGDPAPFTLLDPSPGANPGL